MVDVVGEGVVNANKVIMIKLKNVHAIQFSNAHLQVSSVFNKVSPPVAEWHGFWVHPGPARSRSR